MKINSKIRLLFLFILIGFISSCVKTKDYPVTPVIEYKDFVKYGQDSAEMIVKFKDGDGDIGLNKVDTFPPFNPPLSNIYYTNIHMKYYFKDVDGNFYPFDTNPDPIIFDTLDYKYRIPNITPRGQNKVLDGEIKVKLQAPYYVPGHTVIKFDIYIFDRALHKSNVVTSPEITVN